MKKIHSRGPDNPRINRLESVTDKLSTSSKQFAESLLEKYHKHGTLSSKQWHWVNKLADDVLNPQPVAGAKKIGTMKALFDLLTQAKEHLKFPKLWLETEAFGADYLCPVCTNHMPMVRRKPDETVDAFMARLPVLSCPTGDGGRMKPVAVGHPIRLSICGPASRYVGEITVSSKGGWGDSTWYGHVNSMGEWVVPQTAKNLAEIPFIENLLLSVSQDPEGHAARHGKLHGYCCFCSLPLSDERSTEVGYGPTCAEHFHLPWGKKEKAA